MAGLAPAVIATAEYDPLRDQGDHYARKLADAVMPVRHLRVEGAAHGFLSFTGSVRLSRDILNQLSDAVAAAFDRRDLPADRRPLALWPPPPSPCPSQPADRPSTERKARQSVLSHLAPTVLP
ncbi:alpha/beta hydrolase fold domain-containing protein [Streptomyces sp. Vc74B-19]|uniref:alpha/beta hydrolase fold domain-containing protein n=1 Tax=Streptomyces sp. Vc74B-19 TaxID=2741324 RepID=UPI0027E33E5D|nr:alpha/beta hydrolase fold domain-containing protein [Streptomyces sp. Vc74B-19]